MSIIFIILAKLLTKILKLKDTGLYLTHLSCTTGRLVVLSGYQHVAYSFCRSFIQIMFTSSACENFFRDSVWSLLPPPTLFPSAVCLWQKKVKVLQFQLFSDKSVWIDTYCWVVFWVLATGSSVGDSNICPNTEGSLSDLPFPNFSFSTFLRDRQCVWSFPVFWRKLLCPPRASWRNCLQL